MTTHDTAVTDLMAEALEELNEQRPAKDRISPQPDDTLFGEGGVLDSLGLVTLITILEEKLEDRFDRTISLVSEDALALSDSPFASLTALTAYVQTLVS